MADEPPEWDDLRRMEGDRGAVWRAAVGMSKEHLAREFEGEGPDEPPPTLGFNKKIRRPRKGPRKKRS